MQKVGMINQMHSFRRREFIASTAAFAVGASIASDSRGKRKWYRGNLHTHTLLSDGRALPEEAALLYKRFGYDFLVYSDHNKVFSDGNLWINAKNRPNCFKEENIARFRRVFPECPPEFRTEPDGTVSYRLKTFDELSRQLNVPGKFLVVSGCEYHNNSANGIVLHCNGINTRTSRIHKAVPDEHASLANLLEEHAKTCPPGKVKSLFTVNHPFWYHYDLDPMFLADHPEVRFFEIANAISPPVLGMMEGAYSPDKLWDVALAHRASRGEPVLYAVAADDIHHYERMYGEFEGKKNPMRKCHVRVRARELTVDALIDAMNKGDFYASNGVELNDVKFDRSSGTLSVDVNPGEFKNIVIRFYGTKKGFDGTVGEGTEYLLKDLAAERQKQVPAWAGKKRRIRKFSDDIGTVLKEVRGTKASYTLQKDDLYVRAKVFERTRAGNEDTLPPYTYVAWTQPYGFGR